MFLKGANHLFISHLVIEMVEVALAMVTVS